MTDSVNNVSASLEGLSRRYEAISHNLANSSTPAFKRQCVSFKQMLTAAASGAGGTGSAATVQGLSGIDFSQGGLEQTDRPLDFALSGKGFFALETPQGTLYTRSGTFTMNSNRQLVNSAGLLVAGQAGPIVLPPNSSMADVRVSPEGEIVAGGASLGQLKIVDFAQTADLTPIGSGCFRAPAAAATVPADGTVRQGYREMSNVNVAQELVDLIKVTRLYEANLKTISATDERMKDLIQVAMS